MWCFQNAALRQQCAELKQRYARAKQVMKVAQERLEENSRRKEEILHQRQKNKDEAIIAESNSFSSLNFLSTVHYGTHTCTRLFYGPGEPVPEPVWILLEQETVSGSGISWAICKSSHHLDSTPPLNFYSAFALPAVQPTASKH